MGVERQEWDKEVKKQKKNWSTPEAGGDLDNTWEGCPAVEIQQHARKDSTGKSFLPLNSTGNFKVFHERAPELAADATTAQRKAWWDTFYGTYYLNPDDKLLSYYPKADLKIIGYSEEQTGVDWSGLIYCIEGQISDNGTHVPIFAKYSDTPAGNYFLMVVFPTTGVSKKYAGPVRLYLNYKARVGEYHYLPQAVAPPLQLAGTTGSYSAVLTRKDFQALGTKALYSGLHKTAHITKLVEIPMEQKDLVLHHHGLDEQGENRSDSTTSRIED